MFLTCLLAGSSSAQDIDVPTELKELVPRLREQKKLVGLGAMVMVDGKVLDSAVDGVRLSGNKAKLTIEDRWHLGSITKSVTATMIARLVESGVMAWSDTVGDRFSDANVHETWKSVTLKQLLNHTSGAPADFSVWVRLRRPVRGPKRMAARKKAVQQVMSQPMAQTPGEEFRYSNVGYTIAGAMAETATGMLWEDLVEEQVFKPLKLRGAGFGPPSSSNREIEQPRGHISVFGWKTAVQDDSDNTPIMGPAGTVHMSLRDLCVYADAHLRGHLGQESLLKKDTFCEMLHQPELNQYACGWIRIDSGSRTPHEIYWHNGSNTMWYGLIAFVPDKKMVIAITSNDGDIPRADAAAWEIVGGFIPTGRYRKLSPFQAVRWQDDRVEVMLEGNWFRLVSIDDISTADILAFCRDTYADTHQKRFEEDLVEVLTLMKRPPGDSVSLVVESPDQPETQTFEDVPLTEENREKIKNAAKARKPPVSEEP